MSETQNLTGFFNGVDREIAKSLGNEAPLPGIPDFGSFCLYRIYSDVFETGCGGFLC